MTAELVFMMGSFEARFPTDRLYAKNHMWAELREPSVYRCGLTAYLHDWVSGILYHTHLGMISTSK